MQGFPSNPKTNKVANTRKASSDADGAARAEFVKLVKAMNGIELCKDEDKKDVFLKSAGVWCRPNGCNKDVFWARRLVCPIHPTSSFGFPFCDMDGNQIPGLGQSAGLMSFAPVFRSKADFRGLCLVVPKPGARYGENNQPVSFLIVGVSWLSLEHFQGNGPFRFDTNPDSICSWIARSNATADALRDDNKKVKRSAPATLPPNVPPPPSVKNETVQLIKSPIPVKREPTQLIKAPATVKPQGAYLNEPEYVSFGQRENLIRPDNSVCNYRQGGVYPPTLGQDLIDPRRPSNMSDISQSGPLTFEYMDDDDVKHRPMDGYNYLDLCGLCPSDGMSYNGFGCPSPQIPSFPRLPTPPTSCGGFLSSQDSIETIGSSSMSLSHSELPSYEDLVSCSPPHLQLPPPFSNYPTKSPAVPCDDSYYGDMSDEGDCPDNNPFHRYGDDYY